MCSQLDYGHIDYETFLKWYNFLALIKTADYNVDDYYNSYYSYLRKLFECIVVCKTDEELRSLPIYNRALIQAMKAELREFEKRMSEGKQY